MSAAARLCQIIAQGGKVSAGSYDGDDGFAALIRHGYLRGSGVLASVVCDECDAPHSAQVVYEGEQYGYFCPDLGFLSLDPVRVAAFSPDIPKLIERLADALKCRQRKSSSIHSKTWRIGAVRTDAATVMIYFHPALATEDDVRALQGALRREARSEWQLVVTAQGALPMAGLATVRLDDLVEIDTATGALCVIADLGVLVDLPRKNLGGRPSSHGPKVLSLIQERISGGHALKGRNEEANAVLHVFAERFPTENAPSQSSVRQYVTKARTGQ